MSPSRNSFRRRRLPLAERGELALGALPVASLLRLPSSLARVGGALRVGVLSADCAGHVGSTFRGV